MSQPPRFIREPPPPAIVYNTSMTTPDAALALAALWAAERERRARVGGVCVTGGGFKAAVFCDLVNQFYRPGRRLGNDALAVGLADIDALPADEPMAAIPVDRIDASGDALYARTIELPTDTSLAEAHLRNAITFNAQNSVVLSAPATSLAGSLRIVNNRDLYSEPVRRLVIVDSPRLHSDAAALEFLLENWPTEIVLVGPELGEELGISSSELDAAFGWADAHPVVDAYRAYRRVPYEVPVLDLIAMLFAIAPESEPFALAPAGRTQALRLDSVTAGSLRAALVQAASKNPN